MPSISQNIEGALNAQLAAVSGIPTIAYAGKPFSPTTGTAYVRAVYNPTSGRPFSISGASKMHQGTFEVAVVYPANTATGAASAMADLIRESFAPGSILTLNGVRLKIRYAERRAAMIDGEWVRVPVSIAWRVSSTAN